MFFWHSLKNEKKKCNDLSKLHSPYYFLAGLSMQLTRTIGLPDFLAQLLGIL
jgi:hypothetical protein